MMIQGPRSSGCRGCSCTRQFWATGACTRQFSAILLLIYTFPELLLTLSSFSKVCYEIVTFMTKMSLFPAHFTLSASVMNPSIQTHYKGLVYGLTILSTKGHSYRITNSNPPSYPCPMFPYTEYHFSLMIFDFWKPKYLSTVAWWGF